MLLEDILNISVLSKRCDSHIHQEYQTRQFKKKCKVGLHSPIFTSVKLPKFGAWLTAMNCINGKQVACCKEKNLSSFTNLQREFAFINPTGIIKS